MKTLRYFTTFLSIILFLVSYQQNVQGQVSSTSKHDMKMKSSQPKIVKAIAVINGTKGNNVSGIVTFTKENDKIKVVADITGLTPGKHGFHIHEYGDCSSEDGSSAGGHFNPDKVKHGAPMSSMSHVGDLGNIEADNNGKAHLEITDSLLSFSGKHSIIGRSIVIHSGTDDFVSQSAGNAGSRIACGVIGIAKP